MLQTTKYQQMNLTEALEQGKSCVEDNYLPVVVPGTIGGNVNDGYWLTDGTASIPLGYNAFASKRKTQALKTKLAHTAGKNISLIINGLLVSYQENVFIAVEDITLAPERQGALSLYQSSLEGALTKSEEGGGLSLAEDE